MRQQGLKRIGNSGNFDGGVPRTPAVSESDIGEKNRGCVESLERVTSRCNVGRRLAWGNVQFAENSGVDGDKPFIVLTGPISRKPTFGPRPFVVQLPDYTWGMS